MLRNILGAVTGVRTEYRSEYVDISTHFQDLLYNPLATLLFMRPLFTGKSERQPVMNKCFSNCCPEYNKALHGVNTGT